MKTSSLRALAALIKRSTLKVGVLAQPLMASLNAIVRASDEELKPAALDCISILAKVLKHAFAPYVSELFAIVVPGIEGDDIALSVACLRTIHAMLSADPDGLRPVMGALFSKLEKRASTDYSAAFLHALSHDNHPVPESIFAVTAISLKILGKMTVKFPQAFAELSPRLLALCNAHKISTSSEVRRTVATTIRFLAESASRAWEVAKFSQEDQKTGVKRLFEILVPMLAVDAPQDVTCEVMRGASAIIAWFGYDMAVDFLGFFIDTAREIVISPAIQKCIETDRPVEVFDHLVDFAAAICDSARAEAPRFLGPLIDPFLALVEAPSITYRLHALRFLGVVVISCPSRDNPEVTLSTIRFAMSMAETEMEATPFHVLFKIIQYAKPVFESLSEQCYALLIDRLRHTFDGSERSLRCRDACVSCLCQLLCVFFKDPGRDCNAEELFPTVLSALPLCFDFTEIKRVAQFLRLCERRLMEDFADEYFRVLVEWFANSTLMLERMRMDATDLSNLRIALCQMAMRIDNAEDVYAELLRGHPLKIECVRQQIEQATAELVPSAP
jgi:hypothetical protein